MRLNAASFIVTIYGDVVVPRGGVLWTGSLIQLCGRVGINESLVRTALSRLVSANQLAGERIGRRSYYRLQGDAVASFSLAADLLYGPELPARGWQILYDPNLSPDAARRQRMGHMGGSVFIRPDRGQSWPKGALVFHADTLTKEKRVQDFWDLSRLAEGYVQFVQRFADINPSRLGDDDALVTRLQLVHSYRFVMLRDPGLPVEHLPPGWKAAEARALFRRIYTGLTPAAQRSIAGCCADMDGQLPAETEATRQRHAALIAPE